MKEQVIFGSGDLWGVDENGAPVRFGVLQDVSPDFSFTVKELRGKNLFAKEVRRTEGKITFKAKVGKINGALLNKLFFSGTQTAGRERFVAGEAASVPADAGPYEVVVANGADFVADLGVRYADTGEALDQVAAGNEAAGAYSVDAATGTYTFDAADTEADVLIDYAWNDAASGQTIAVSNDVAGASPIFSVYLRDSDDEGEFGIKLYACTSNKLAIATKMGDFAIPEFDFQVLANAAGKVADILTE